jgi:ABC-type multidrug transport system ATPase subunit
MLKAIGLSKNYNGATALDALDLNVEAGEVYLNKKIVPEF